MSDDGRTDERAVVPALLVTGAPGVGKTVVAREIRELLRLAGAPHAVIDLDELGRDAGLPGVTDDDPHTLIVRNLTMVWPNYQALVVQRLVLGRPTTDVATEVLTGIGWPTPNATSGGRR